MDLPSKLIVNIRLRELSEYYLIPLSEHHKMLEKLSIQQRCLLSFFSTLLANPLMVSSSGLKIEVGYSLARIHMLYLNLEIALELLRMVKFEASAIKDYRAVKFVYLKLAEVGCMMGKYKLGLLYAQR